MARERFPEGSFFLPKFRLKDRTLWSLCQSPEARKTACLSSIIAGYPGRRFILVGDSTERDPEVYGALAQQFSEQVEAIYIHNVSGEHSDSVRMQVAFEGVAAERWTLLEDPDRL